MEGKDLEKLSLEELEEKATETTATSSEEAKEAIEKCSNAGILTIMITGDHVLTATAIAKELRNIKKWKNCYGRNRT